MDAFVAYCPPSGPPDLLSEVLQDLRLAKASYGRSEFTAPWGIEIPFKDGVRFHFVAEGSCWMRTAAHGSIRLDAGDVILLPHGTAHALADHPARETKPLAEIGPRLIGNATYSLSTGGGGERTLIVCCTIGFDGPTAHPLIELLPSVLHIRRADGRDASLPMLLDLMAKEVAEQRVGSATVMARLADIVMTRIVRAWVETLPSNMTGWLAAMKDPHIGRALARIHRDPGMDWSVAALADVARMSRSNFVERFTSLLTASPARYLTQWRMHLADAWLRQDQLSVAEIAHLLGYDSYASFSRAFKRSMGVSPTIARSRSVPPGVNGSARPVGRPALPPPPEFVNRPPKTFALK